MRSPDTAVPLAPFTTLGVGGPARWYVAVRSIDDLRAAYAWAREREVPVTVLAGGSNVVIADSGVDGLVVHIELRGVERSRRGSDEVLTVAAGESWDEFVALTVAEGLGGVECLSGIPGTVGGTPIQNVGAYGQEVSRTIERLTVFDTGACEMHSLMASECHFGYRRSRFKRQDRERLVICDVTFRLSRRPATIAYPDLSDWMKAQGISTPSVAQAREAVLAVRRRKGMVLDGTDVDTRSVGSFFTNVVVTDGEWADLVAQTSEPVPSFPAGPGLSKVPAAWLLERAGFGRGYGGGAVGLSSKHPLAIVNRGGATAREVVEFAVRLKQAVLEQFGVALTPEPTFLGFGDDPQVSVLRAEQGNRVPFLRKA